MFTDKELRTLTSEQMRKHIVENMPEYPCKMECPNCKKIVRPKHRTQSLMFHCPKCYKGEAGLVWWEVE